VGETDRAAERLAQARSEVEQVRRLLLDPTPAAVAQCAGHLAEAAGALGALQRDLPEGQTWRLKPDLRSLRRELDRAGKLLEGAAAWQAGWARIVASAGGYTQSGELPELTAQGRLSVQG
jgi:hypothetical protein